MTQYRYSLVDKFNKYLEMISFIVVILGVPAFFYQQYEDSKLQQTQQTLNFINMFQGERIAKARSNLLLPWSKYAPEIQMINVGQGIDVTMLHRWVDKMIEVSSLKNAKDNLMDSVYTMTDFFDQLHLCIVKGVCQGEIARRYFEEYAIRFNCLYGKKIEEQRIGLAIRDFGNGVKFFASQKDTRCFDFAEKQHSD